MKRDFFYDEEIIAKNIFENGFKDGYTRWQATMVAKYLRWTLGYGDARVESSLVKFCKQYDRNFVEVRQRRSIKTAVRNSRSEYIKKASPISITKKELETVRTIRNFKAQRALLGFLIYAKRDGGYVNRRNWVDVKRIAGLKISKKELNVFARIFYEMGIIEIKGNSHLVKMIDQESEVVFTIKNEKMLYSIVNLYKEYCGGELSWCLLCGKEIIKNSNRQCLCDECWNERQKEVWRKNSKKYYVNKKSHSLDTRIS